MSSNVNQAGPAMRGTTRADTGAADEAYLEPSFLRRLTWVDWLFALALAVGAGVALSQYGQWMNGYDKAVLIGAVPTFALLGWHWKAVRPLMLALTALSLFAIQLYQGQLARTMSRRTVPAPRGSARRARPGPPAARHRHSRPAR